MEREKANHDVRRMSRLLGVSPSGYYAWRTRPECPRKKEDARLRALIAAIHTRSRGNYGMPRIWDELRYDHNVRCSGKRVRRLMHQLGIKGTHRRRYRKTTERDASLAVAPDLMNRDFSANKPDEKYVGDITYIRTWEGWLYLAIILDVFSRRIVGWAMGTTLHTELVVEAFEMAVRRRQAKGAIAHSDQGCPDSTPALPTIGASARRAWSSPWAVVAIVSITRWPSPSSPPSSASCSTARPSTPERKHEWRSSTSSRATTTPSAVTPRSACPGSACNRQLSSNSNG